MAKSITIVGGGLAGLALGIGLRRQGVPVTIYEAGQYPRHRVCGEFVSGRGQQFLERLGLGSLLAAAGAVPARTVAFFSANTASPARLLPFPALCLSRWQMDARLAEAFQSLGGELHSGQRTDANPAGEGRVRANGRRLAADDAGPRWFGLKIHARQVSLEADLEMHVSPQGYVGLCRIEHGEVNVCGLFRRHPADALAPKAARQLLLGSPGSLLHQRLAGAEFDEASFCAVAGLSLAPVRAAVRPEVCVGDALTMIPPVTGNGMSMAFESAEIALGPLADWSRGEGAWPEARRAIAQQCDRQFARRLFWARQVQRLILTAPLQNSLVALARWQPWLWRLAFAGTR
jgi:2-polyprenyl-6-methoxyphenol hydroxylase-like FAD-dependent oxidoreductase